MPRIGIGHAGSTGGIFSLLQDPGGEHTTSSGAEDSGFVDIDNDDPTAKWCKELYERLGIPKSAITPWNALGGYNEKKGAAAIEENLPLCQSLLNTAAPVALIAQGKTLAHRMAKRLQFPRDRVFLVPHPSRRGRSRNGEGYTTEEAGKKIETAFQAAFALSIEAVRNSSFPVAQRKGGNIRPQKKVSNKAMKQRNLDISEAAKETWKNPKVAAARMRRNRVEVDGIVYRSFYRAALAVGVIEEGDKTHITARGKCKEKGKYKWHGKVFILREEW